MNICVIHSFWSDHRDHSGIPSEQRVNIFTLFCLESIHRDSALLVLNGTLLNSDNPLLALN